MTLTFELIRSQHALLALSRRWSELASQQVRPSPFIDTTWLYTWMEHFGKDRELAVGVFRHCDIIVGIAPLCRRTQTNFGLLAFNTLEFLGAGYGPADVWSEHLGLTVAPHWEAAVAQSFVDNLYAGSFGYWDECLLDMMDGEALVCANLKTAIRQRIGKLPEETIEKSYYIPHKPNWPEYLNSLSKHYRSQMRRDLRNFERWVGERGYQLNTVTDFDSLKIGFDVLCSLHNERWSAEQKEGAFCSRRFFDFHRAYVSRALSKSELKLYWLTVGDAPVAAEYAISYGNKLYLYQCGRSVNLPEEIRIGHVSLMLVISDAMKQGFSEIDFMCGDQEYKRRYTTTSRPLVSLRLVHSRSKNSLRTVRKALNRTSRTIENFLAGQASVKLGSID